MVVCDTLVLRDILRNRRWQVDVNKVSAQGEVGSRCREAMEHVGAGLKMVRRVGRGVCRMNVERRERWEAVYGDRVGVMSSIGDMVSVTGCDDDAEAAAAEDVNWP
jgi:hypothetical protein